VSYQAERYCLALDIPNTPMSYGVTDLTPLTSSCPTGYID